QQAADCSRWISSRSNFLVHVNVLARLFRAKFLTMVMDAHADGQLKFFNTRAGLADKRTFKRFLAPLRRIKWVVYCKEPFAGPKQVLRYLSRYTHRVAISNRRLVAADDGGVSFRWKDYRIEGPGRWKTMTLAPLEFIRRFLMHYRRASIASATTGCSPTLTEPRASPRRVNCSPWRHRRRNPRPLQRPSPISPACCRTHAPAAVVA